MSTKSIILLAIVFGLLVLGMFVFAYLYQQEQGQLPSAEKLLPQAFKSYE
ncbi:MAG: hypothetical protein AAB388_00675 [Patescibacteria group bacterium]